MQVCFVSKSNRTWIFIMGTIGIMLCCTYNRRDIACKSEADSSKVYNLLSAWIFYSLKPCEPLVSLLHRNMQRRYGLCSTMQTV